MWEFSDVTITPCAGPTKVTLDSAQLSVDHFKWAPWEREQPIWCGQSLVDLTWALEFCESILLKAVTPGPTGGCKLG